ALWIDLVKGSVVCWCCPDRSGTIEFSVGGLHQGGIWTTSIRTPHEVVQVGENALPRQFVNRSPRKLAPSVPRSIEIPILSLSYLGIRISSLATVQAVHNREGACWGDRKYFATIVDASVT